jgi:hypothetical protein
LNFRPLRNQEDVNSMNRWHLANLDRIKRTAA